MAVLTHVVNPARRERNEVDQVTAAVTLTAADSGKWYELAASAGVTVTLPAVSSGLNFRFVVANAFDTSNYIIDSAEGDNIDGNLIVNGAAVAASGEDQINFGVMVLNGMFGESETQQVLLQQQTQVNN